MFFKPYCFNKIYYKIFRSFFISYIFYIIPIPNHLSFFKPSFYFLFLIYWLLQFPHKINIISIFFLGIIIDIFEDNVIGIKSISLMVTTYLIFNFQMILYLNKLKQSLIIMIISMIIYFIFYTLEFIVLNNLFKLNFLFTSIMNGVFWPFIVYFMDKIK